MYKLQVANILCVFIQICLNSVCTYAHNIQPHFQASVQLSVMLAARVHKNRWLERACNSNRTPQSGQNYLKIEHLAYAQQHVQSLYTQLRIHVTIFSTGGNSDQFGILHTQLHALLLATCLYALLLAGMVKWESNLQVRECCSWAWPKNEATQ